MLDVCKCKSFGDKIVNIQFTGGGKVKANLILLRRDINPLNQWKVSSALPTLEILLLINIGPLLYCDERIIEDDLVCPPLEPGIYRR